MAQTATRRVGEIERTTPMTARVKRPRERWGTGWARIRSVCTTRRLALSSGSSPPTAKPGGGQTTAISTGGTGPPERRAAVGVTVTTPFLKTRPDRTRSIRGTFHGVHLEQDQEQT